MLRTFPWAFPSAPVPGKILAWDVFCPSPGLKACMEAYMKPGCSVRQSTSWVPLPWCTSKSTTATLPTCLRQGKGEGREREGREGGREEDEREEDERAAITIAVSDLTQGWEGIKRANVWIAHARTPGGGVGRWRGTLHERKGGSSKTRKGVVLFSSSCESVFL